VNNTGAAAVAATNELEPLGLRYLEVGARSLEQSVAFYVDLLGFSTVAPPVEQADGRVQWVASGSVQLRIVEAGRDATPGDWRNDDLQRGVRHFGFKVEDIDAWCDRLVAAGVEFLSNPTDVLGDVRIAFFLDPAGTRIELVQGNLSYQHVDSPRAAAEDGAIRMAPADPPRFDHVAFTVADLERSLAFYCDRLGYELIGSIRHEGDPRGFLMTYVQAGPAVLEIFSFDAATSKNPARRGAPVTGIRSIGLGANDPDALQGEALAAGRAPDRAWEGPVLDPDGLPLSLYVPA